MSNKAVALFLAADVYYRFKDPVTGVFSNPIKIETEKLEINTPSELTEKLSKGRDTYNQAFVSHRVPQPTEFAITFSEQSREVFAMALAGTLETINEASATLTDHEVTVVLDEWVEVGHRHLNPTGLTVTNAGGTTTYVEGTDYQINPRLGLIKALSTGSIAAGVVEISGTTLAKTGSRIIGARQYGHVLSFKADGRNQIDNKDTYIEAYQATVSADAARDFLSGEIDSLELTGRLEIPAGGNTPFVMELFD